MVADRLDAPRRVGSAGHAPAVHTLRRGGELTQLTDYAEPVTGLHLPDGRVLVEIDEARKRADAALHPRGRAARQRSALQPLDAPRLARRSAARLRDEPPQRARLRHRRSASSRAGRSGRSSSAACAPSGEISPDGRWVVAGQLGELSGDSNLFLLGIESGEVVHVTPHEGAAEYVEPVWLADSSGFLCATNEGRDTVRDLSLHARRRLGGRARVGVGSRVLRRRRGPARDRGRERGRLLP